MCVCVFFFCNANFQLSDRKRASDLSSSEDRAQLPSYLSTNTGWLKENTHFAAADAAAARSSPATTTNAVPTAVRVESKGYKDDEHRRFGFGPSARTMEFGRTLSSSFRLHNSDDAPSVDAPPSTAPGKLDDGGGDSSGRRGGSDKESHPPRQGGGRRLQHQSSSVRFAEAKTSADAGREAASGGSKSERGGGAESK
jgi:hypothetical protein